MRRCNPIGIFFVAMIFLLSGCGGVTPDQLAAIKLGAQTAKERASAFNLAKNNIVAKNASEKDAITLYLDLHYVGLSAEAKGLSDLAAGIEATNNISEQMKTQIVNETESAEARAKNFIAMSKLMAPTNPADAAALSQWLSDHGESLKKQAETLRRISDKYTKNKSISIPPTQDTAPASVGVIPVHQ